VTAMAKRLSVVLAGLVAALALLQPAVAAGPAPGDKAAPFILDVLNPEQDGKRRFVLKTLVGPAAKDGPKAVLLSFAASWCKPCKKELPQLQQIVARYPTGVIATAVVVIDKEKELIDKMLKQTVEEAGIRLPLLADRFNIVARRYAADEIPYLVLIDSAGRVVWTHRGYDPETMQALSKQLAALLGPPPAPSAGKGKAHDASEPRGSAK
jgi:cytochrome c biogenesis protein CcmG, thiol:disulfide interchange protein DsbE